MHDGGNRDEDHEDVIVGQYDRDHSYVNDSKDQTDVNASLSKWE